MLDRYGNEIDPELPPEVPASDEEPDGPPEEWMAAHCEFCDDQGIRLNQLGRCNHVDYGAIAKRHLPGIKKMLKKENR
jgi:hypothetical protein